MKSTNSPLGFTLKLGYTINYSLLSLKSRVSEFGGQGWIRTIVLKWEQIYSLPPLATRPPTHIFNFLQKKWCALKDSNLGPTGYEPVALTNWAKGAFLNARISIIYFYLLVNIFLKKFKKKFNILKL